MSLVTYLMMTKEEMAPYVPISPNIDDDYINPSILAAQEKYIRDLLCDDLYLEVIEQLESGYPDAATEELMPYVKRCLAFYAYSEFLPNHAIKSTESGVVRKTDDYSQVADTSLITNNVKQAIGNGQQFGYRLVQFIKANIADYPMFEECDCKDQGDNQFWGVF